MNKTPIVSQMYRDRITTADFRLDNFYFNLSIAKMALFMAAFFSPLGAVFITSYYSPAAGIPSLMLALTMVTVGMVVFFAVNAVINFFSNKFVKKVLDEVSPETLYSDVDPIYSQLYTEQEPTLVAT